jgi:hypothetical protein
VAAAPPLLFALAEDLLPRRTLEDQAPPKRQASERDDKSPTSVVFFMWPLEEIFFFSVGMGKNECN